MTEDTSSTETPASRDPIGKRTAVIKTAPARTPETVVNTCSRRDVISSRSSGKSRDSSHSKELDVNNRKSYSNSRDDSDTREIWDIRGRQQQVSRVSTEVLFSLLAEYGIFEKHTEFRGIPRYFYSRFFPEFRGIPYVFAYGIPQITK
jgi:hypothetical protein